MQCTEISKLPTSQTTPSERDSAALLLARARAHRGATEAALGQLSEVLAARPAHAEARLLQLDILHRSGDESALDDAMAAARTSVPAGDDDAGVALCQCASSTGSMSTPAFMVLPALLLLASTSIVLAAVQGNVRTIQARNE